MGYRGRPDRGGAEEGLLFRGRSAHTLDTKGRLSIPARFRDVLVAKYDQRLIITNLPYCLVAYPYEEWRRIEERFSQEPLQRPEVQRFLRFFIASAVECSLDKQGRILIPPHLREEVGIERDVILLGLLNRFEIWSKERLEEELKQVRDNFEHYSEFVADINRLPGGAS